MMVLSNNFVPQLRNLKPADYIRAFQEIRSDPSFNPTEMIPLHDGDPDFKTPQNIVDATIKALREGWTHYPPREGDPILKREIANYHSKYGIDWKPENVIVTPGSYQAFYLAVMASVKEGDEVLFLTPGYMGYFPLFDYLGAKIVHVPLNGEGWRLNSDMLQNKITKKTKLIIACTPNNPTGTVFTYDEMKAISDITIDHDLLLVSDEIYNEFVWDNRKHLSFAAMPGMLDHTIVVQSFSKTFAMTGWRLGYLLAKVEMINEIKKIPTEFRPPQFVSKGAIEAFRGSWNYVNEMKNEYYRRLNYLKNRLNQVDGIKCAMPEGAFYLMPNIEGTGKNSIDFTIALGKIGKVFAMPGVAFGAAGENHVRLALIRSIETLEKTAQGFEATVKAIM